MYHFIINPNSRSGHGLFVWNTIKTELDKRGITYRYYFTKHCKHATDITKDICSSQKGIINLVVLGGDGTVNEVINGITDYSNVLLAYIPSGSSNDLARSLKLPKDPLIGLNNILKPRHFRYLDLGYIQYKDMSKKFAVSTGMGLDAGICKESSSSPLKKTLNKLKLGKFIYLFVSLKQLMTCKFLEGEILVDNKKRLKYDKILLITSMIHKYEGGGICFAPKANPVDGRLSICIIHGLSRPRLFTLFPALLYGRHIYYKGVETFDCTTLSVKLKSSACVHIDGEYPGNFYELNISCIEKQIRIIT